MGRPQVSFAKRQREQAKRERQQLKAARRQERKNDPKSPEDGIETVDVDTEGIDGEVVEGVVEAAE